MFNLLEREHSSKNNTAEIGSGVRVTCICFCKTELWRIISLGCIHENKFLRGDQCSFAEKGQCKPRRDSRTRNKISFFITYHLGFLPCLFLHTNPYRDNGFADFYGEPPSRPQTNLEHYQDKVVRDAWLTESPPAKEE